jgi:hypothetical protein
VKVIKINSMAVYLPVIFHKLNFEEVLVMAFEVPEFITETCHYLMGFSNQSVAYSYFLIFLT